MKDWFVYILECADGSYYTGIAPDVQRRLHDHNSTNRGAKYTRSRRPCKLVWQSYPLDRSGAARLEYTIKLMPHDRKKEVVTSCRA